VYQAKSEAQWLCVLELLYTKVNPATEETKGRAQWLCVPMSLERNKKDDQSNTKKDKAQWL
jgi:hypothetical protein